MTIQIIEAGQLRTTQGGPGIGGQVGVTYQDRTTGEMYRWSPEEGVMKAVGAVPGGGNLGIFASEAALQAAFPAGVANRTASVGTVIPYTLYIDDGTAWVPSGTRSRVFVDAVKPAASGPQAIVSSTFTTVVLPAQTLGAGTWTSNGWVVPVTGRYLLVGGLRLADGIAVGTNVGIGINSATGDFEGFVWQAVGATRASFQYARYANFTQGQNLRLFTWVGQAANLETAFMSAQLVA